MINSLYLKQRYPGIITDSFYTNYQSYLQLIINEKYQELDSCFWGEFYDRAVTLASMSELLKNPPAESVLGGSSTGVSGPETSRSVVGEYSVSYASKSYIAQSFAEFNGNEFDIELDELRKKCGLIPGVYPSLVDSWGQYYGIEPYYLDCCGNVGSTVVPSTPSKLSYQSNGINNQSVIKASPGIVFSFSALNTDSQTHYILLFNNTFSPQNGDVPFKIPFPIYPTSGLLIIDTDYFGQDGTVFNLGISWAVSTTPNVLNLANANTTFFELYYV